jgi:hypothetical protein
MAAMQITGLSASDLCRVGLMVVGGGHGALAVLAATLLGRCRERGQSRSPCSMVERANPVARCTALTRFLPL